MLSDNSKVLKNIILLNEIKNQYNFSLASVYSRLCDRTTRIEYCKGSNVLPYGYYTFDFEHKLFIDDYRKGRLFNYPVSGYNYKYFFDGDELIMIETYGNNIKRKVTIIHHFETSRILIDYHIFISKSDSMPTGLKICQYNQSGQLIKYLDGGITGDQIRNYSVQSYEYSSSEFIFSKHSYYYLFSNITVSPDMTFPLSALNENVMPKSFKKINNSVIKNLLFNNFLSILNSWPKDHIYAISFIIHSQSTIEVDYAIDYDKVNVDEKYIWDYSYWIQHSESLLKTEDERNIFEIWKNQDDEIQISNIDLIESKSFNHVLSSMVKEFRRNELMRQLHLENIPILVTNFDIDESIYRLNKKLNNGKLPDGYVNWYNTTQSIGKVKK